MILKAQGSHTSIDKGVHHARIIDVNYLKKSNGDIKYNKHGDIGIIFKFHSEDQGGDIEKLYWFAFSSDERYYKSKNLLRCIGLDNREGGIKANKIIGKELYIIVAEFYDESGEMTHLDVIDISKYNEDGHRPAVSQNELVRSSSKQTNEKEKELKEAPEPEKSNETQTNF